MAALVHTADFATLRTTDDDALDVLGRQEILVLAGDYALHVSPAPFVSPGMVYVGSEEKETTEMSATTLNRTLDQAIDEHAKEPPQTDPIADIREKIQGVRVRGVTIGRMEPVPPGGTGVAEHVALPTPEAVIDQFVDRIEREMADAKGTTVTFPKTTDTTIVLRIPTEMDFFGADFLADPHLQRLADQLCATHDLPAKDHVTILWKRKGGSSGGKATMGKCLATGTGLLGFYVPTDFHIWLAADHARGHQLTPKQLEALCFHELSHIDQEVDEKTGETTLVLVAHDFTGFHRELDLYGCWQDDLAMAKASFEQARLW